MSKILLALLIAAFFWPAQALTLSPQMGLHEPASLAGHLTALVDASGTLRIEDVVASAKATEFSALPGFLGAGYTADTQSPLQPGLFGTQEMLCQVRGAKLAQRIGQGGAHGAPNSGLG